MVAARWAAEQLLGLDSSRRTEEDEELVDDFCIENDEVELARAYFEKKEFMRAAHVVRQSTSSRAVFLRGYAKFLAGEKYKADNRAVASANSLKPCPGNPYLDDLRVEIQQHSEGSKDGFIHHLYGMVLKELDLTTLAREALVQAVFLYPCNWAAWQDLATLCPDSATLQSMADHLPVHWTTLFFNAYIWLDLQQPEESIESLDTLKHMLPCSATVDAHIGVAHYNTHSFMESEDVFESIMEHHPHRLEDLEVYSNILHNNSDAATLSQVAQHAVAGDPHRPETCAVVANYYSLKNEHERAVLYFKKALFLDPGFVCAWTLMGHEYCEMKNIAAAIGCYHKAVELNPREYRAWHGLGVSYEDLKMPLYALHYYTRATELRPNDQKCWTSLGRCYESLHCQAQANRCFQRSHGLG